MHRLIRNSLLLLAIALMGTATADDLPRKHAIVASQPAASVAGLEMLRKGGTAIDAAIAAQLVMTLVEPQSSGIGGGSLLVYWDAKKRRVETYDGRETAPASVTPNLFIGKDGKPMNFIEAVVGGKSVGVPGMIAVLALAHKEHGRLPWATLFEPAIKLAENGFTVSRRMSRAATLYAQAIAMVPATAAYLLPNGKPLAEGTIVKNQAYADTLKLLAAKGPDAFYKGPIAQAIVDAVKNAPRNAVDLTLNDLANYKAKKRPPVCGFYRAYKICGMGPPSSGGIATLQILKLMERVDVGKLAANSAPAIHLFAEAQRLAFADRAAYLADADFVPVPVKGLLDARYLAARSRLISMTKAMDRASIAPGNPKGAALTLRRLRLPDRTPPSTAHVSVVDSEGNALAMTGTVEGPFGSQLMAGGFILNNELTDFTFQPAADNRRFANAPEAGKRPLSSMSPTLVFDPKGRLFAVIGSAGSWRIIPFTTKSLIGLIDWKMTMKEAIELPNITARTGATELEGNRGLEAAAEALKAMGHEVALPDQDSGNNGIRITKDGLDAAADPRREGYVAAD